MARMQAGRDGAVSRTYAGAGIRCGRWCWRLACAFRFRRMSRIVQGSKVVCLPAPGQSGIADGRHARDGRL